MAKRICSIPDCEDLFYAREMCALHYRQWWRKHRNRRVCEVDGCEKTHVARGLCSKHYQRLMKTGTVTSKRAARRSPEKIDKTLWTPVNLAWLAGIIEGEGSISLPSPSGAGPRLTVAMTDKDVVQRIAGMAGCGLISEYEPPNPRQKTQWIWKLHRKAHLRALLTEILPWLGERRSLRVQQVLEL